MPEAEALVLSCEHGGARVPARWRSLFRGAGALLASHRGQDLGALALARRIARTTGAPLVATTVTRLLVDCNRSAGHRGAFSELTRGLEASERAAILEEHHAPHRAAVEARIREALTTARRVLHVSVHSFTPDFGGRRRELDVGLLHDPRRPAEAAACRRWRLLLQEARSPELRVRLNQPYRGWTDGLTTHLRSRIPAARYLGLELEVSQAFPLGRGDWPGLQGALARSLRELLPIIGPTRPTGPTGPARSARRRGPAAGG